MPQGIRENEPDARIIYADIIDHPHHQSPTRPHMSLYNRAAQFASFDALSGYSDMVIEEARLTDKAVVLDEGAIERLNQKLSVIADVIEDGYEPQIKVLYFVPDRLKAGGEYAEYSGTVKKIDTITKKIVFSEAETGDESRMPGKELGKGQRSKKAVDIGSIVEIHGELVDYLDDAVL